MSVSNQVVQNSFRVIRTQRLAPRPCLKVVERTIHGVVVQLSQQE